MGRPHQPLVGLGVDLAVLEQPHPGHPEHVGRELLSVVAR